MRLANPALQLRGTRELRTLAKWQTPSDLPRTTGLQRKGLQRKGLQRKGLQRKGLQRKGWGRVLVMGKANPQ
jgi:hypothetical protein